METKYLASLIPYTMSPDSRNVVFSQCLCSTVLRCKCFYFDLILVFKKIIFGCGKHHIVMFCTWFPPVKTLLNYGPLQRLGATGPLFHPFSDLGSEGTDGSWIPSFAGSVYFRFPRHFWADAALSVPLPLSSTIFESKNCISFAQGEEFQTLICR